MNLVAFFFIDKNVRSCPGLPHSRLFVRILDHFLFAVIVSLFFTSSLLKDEHLPLSLSDSSFYISCLCIPSHYAYSRGLDGGHKTATIYFRRMDQLTTAEEIKEAEWGRWQRRKKEGTPKYVIMKNLPETRRRLLYTNGRSGRESNRIENRKSPKLQKILQLWTCRQGLRSRRPIWFNVNDDF